MLNVYFGVDVSVYNNANNTAKWQKLYLLAFVKFMWCKIQ